MTCRVVCRALLIPFIHQLDYNIQSSAAIHDAYEAAPAAGPVLISIGHQLMTIGHEDGMFPSTALYLLHVYDPCFNFNSGYR